MKADELIDDVARQMTATPARPMLRARVMATIDDARQEPPRGWWVPATAGATIAALALAWFMLPSRQVTNGTPVARQAPAITTGPTVVEPTAPIELATTASAPTRRVVAVSAATVSTWPDEIPADFPMLPPLAGPPPIVIEPVRWNDVTITPLTVALIEVKALAIEPLASASDSGA